MTKIVENFREINYFQFLAKEHQHQRKLVNSFPALINETVFKSEKLDDYPTFAWGNQASIIDYDGTVKQTSLDFCPDSLYQMSNPV